jgi:hypothetical protein
MPDTSHAPATPAQFTASLAGLIHGPYDDTGTAAISDLIAEAVRYLNYAVPRGG